MYVYIHIATCVYTHSLVCRYIYTPEVCGMGKYRERFKMYANETYSYGKRGLFIWYKRPMHTLTYQRYAVCVNIERDLRCTQKRPIHMAKEAYSYDK